MSISECVAEHQPGTRSDLRPVFLRHQSEYPCNYTPEYTYCRCHGTATEYLDMIHIFHAEQCGEAHYQPGLTRVEIHDHGYAHKHSRNCILPQRMRSNDHFAHKQQHRKHKHDTVRFHTFIHSYGTRCHHDGEVYDIYYFAYARSFFDHLSAHMILIYPPAEPQVHTAPQLLRSDTRGN